MFGITKWPSFQFLINPSTIFIISGMLVAKYRDDPVENVTSPAVDFMNSSMPIWLTNGYEENIGKNAANHSFIESDYSLDPLTVLEMRLINLIIQGYDNSTNWQLKFVDFPLGSMEKSSVHQEYVPLSHYNMSHSSGHVQRKANVLVTDSQERVPIWAVVNLSTLKVESWTRGKYERSSTPVTGTVTQEEKVIAGEVALANAEVQEKIRAFGYEQIYEVVPDVWDAGFVSGNHKEKLVQIYFYGIREEEGLPYAHPYPFVAFVDLGKNVVREIEDLPLHLNVQKTKTVESAPHAGTVPEQFIRPNTVRSELYQSKEPHQLLGSSFQVSGTEELHR